MWCITNDIATYTQNSSICIIITKKKGKDFIDCRDVPRCKIMAPRALPRVLVRRYLRPMLYSEMHLYLYLYLYLCAPVVELVDQQRDVNIP